MAESSESLHRTPLHAEHVALNARMVPFGGWEMPLTYSGQLAEHNAVRTAVGIFDVSHMGQVRFTGKRALEFLQALVPADIASLTDGKSKYTQLTNERGGVIDDLIISRVGPQEYFAVVNASTRVNDVKWMRECAREWNFNDLNITDESDRWAMIAVQGPTAFEIINKLIPKKDWSRTDAFTLHKASIQGVEGIVSRTGYTGETGAEILVPAENGPALWKALLAAGALPCGLAARDSLRLEAGYCLYGNDLNEETTPVEARLGWSVGWKKVEEYPGRVVLQEQKTVGPSRQLVGLKAEGRKPLRAHEHVVDGEAPVGEITSGGFSPVLQCGIALAYVSNEALQPNGKLAVRTRSGDIPVSIVKTPFVETSLTKKSKAQ